MIYEKTWDLFNRNLKPRELTMEAEACSESVSLELQFCRVFHDVFRGDSFSS